MPRGLSSTVLRASEVRDACNLALEEIKKSRAGVQDTVEQDWVDHYRVSQPDGWRIGGEERALDNIPAHLSMIWKEHRKDDEAVLRAILGLALAAHATDPMFTVEMTADDFRLIEKLYAKTQ